MNTQTYTPGVCNIGPAEIALRKRVGWVSASFSVLLLIVLWVTHAPVIWRLVLFFPFTAAAIGFLQTAFHFCVGYGLSGMYNVLKPAGKAESVEKSEYRNADRIKSVQILLYSIIIGIILAVSITLI